MKIIRLDWVILGVITVACFFRADGAAIGGPAPAEATLAAAEPGGTAVRPQAPPLPPSPIEHFRKLLSMSPEERSKALAARSPKAREFLDAKLKEYQSLPPEQREDRLRTLELRWYLLPLMKASPTNRTARLQLIPERDRSLVEARLQWWDQLTVEQQRDVLECEPAINTFMQPEKPLFSGSVILSSVTPQQRETINKSSAYLNSLPPGKRQEIYRKFREFFELSERERTKTLDSFNEAERKRMERTLQAFENLPAEERERCIAGFEKFRALSPAEQAHFLKSAERWQAMTPKDRQIWRSLVSRKAVPQPPLPPGLGHPAATRTSPDILVTNR